MGKSQNHYAVQKKSDIQDTYYMIAFTWNLRKEKSIVTESG